VIAAVGFAIFIPVTHITHINESRLSSLVLQHSGISDLSSKPENSALLAPATDEFSALRAAEASQPDATGGWSILWGGTKTNIGDYAELLVAQLPSTADARAVLANMKMKYLSPSAWSSESFKRISSFVLAFPPGAGGAIFTKPKTKVIPAATLTTIAFSFDHAAVLDFVELPSASRSAAVGLAKREFALLRSVEPGFSFTRTVVPMVTVVVYWVVAVILAGATLAVPAFVVEERNSRAARLEARRRRQQQLRGTKARKQRTRSARRSNARKRHGRR
jgi:hypothetical protein